MAKRPEHGFTEREIAELNAVCSQEGFLDACWRLRTKYKTSRAHYPNRKPKTDRARYELYIRVLDPDHPSGDRVEPLPSDIARIARRTPRIAKAIARLLRGDATLRDDRTRKAGIAALRRQIERLPKHARENFPVLLLAFGVSELFENFGLRFTSHQNTEIREWRGANVRVLQVIAEDRSQFFRAVIRKVRDAQGAQTYQANEVK